MSLNSLLSTFSLFLFNICGNIQQLFATQYLTFHNDIFYVIILMTQYPQGGDILTDFQSIINSFKFITNS